MGTIEALEYTRYSAPEMFSYQELLDLSEDKKHEPSLADQLQRIRTTPFLSNEAYYRGAKPHVPNLQGLGPSLRLVFLEHRAPHSPR